MLADTADLVAWLRANIAPGTHRFAREDVLAEAPAPLSLQAVDDADALHALIWSWSVDIAEKHRLYGPASEHLVRPAYKHYVLGAHRSGCDGRACRGCLVVYGQARVTGLRAGQGRNPYAISRATHVIAGWLIEHIEALITHPAADVLHDELIGAHRAINARWPRNPSLRKLPIPCPSCDLLMLFLHPPATAGSPVTIVCHTDECGRTLTEGDYYWRVHELHARSLVAVG